MTTTWTSELIEVASTVIAAFESDTSSDLNLSVWFNCGTPVEIAITATNKGDYIDSNNILSLTPTMIGKSMFDVGVYRVQLKYAETNAVLEDNGVVYVDTGINCKLVDHFAQYEKCLLETPCEDNYQFWAFSFHYLLKNLIWCDTTTYTNACQLFTTMNNIITENYDCECKG